MARTAKTAAENAATGERSAVSTAGLAAEVTPMMQQYLHIKEEYADAILFFRIGDFYEMFFDDAKLVSRELELTLTGKDCGLEERAPMCGVPYHAVDTYVARLVEKGYRVAIGEQMTDPALAKGLVDRDVIRIITPGTLTDTAVIGERKNNFLCSLYVQGKRAGLAACDVSTGEFYAQQLPAEQSAVKAALSALEPGEIITNDLEFAKGCAAVVPRLFTAAAFQSQNARETLLSHFGVNSLIALGLDSSLAAAACGAMHARAA